MFVISGLVSTVSQRSRFEESKVVESISSECLNRQSRGALPRMENRPIARLKNDITTHRTAFKRIDYMSRDAELVLWGKLKSISLSTQVLEFNIFHQ
jgi:hypothetical protein